MGPKAQELCVTELKSVGYFGLGLDASNKGNKKLFPLTVRYFSRSDGVKDHLLDFYLDSDEMSAAIADRIKGIIQQHDLDLGLVSAYSADNASVNYRKHVSVYRKLALIQKHLIQANCKCHILNNCVKYGLKATSFDVESFVIKVYNSFSSSAKKATELKEFFEFVQIDYVELLRHVPTCWLSLLPAIDRLLLCWSALKSYFTSTGEDDVASLIWNGFSCDCESVLPQCSLYFIQNVTAIFHEAVKVFESNATTATELHTVMEDVRTKLQQRQIDKFYGSGASQLLQSDTKHSRQMQV